MKINTKLSIILVFSSLITACSSLESRVESKGENRFQISLEKAQKNQTLSYYQELAKYKDAEVTLKHNFKYFVISEETYNGPDNSKRDQNIIYYQNKISCYQQKPNNDSLYDASEYISSHPKPSELAGLRKEEPVYTIEKGALKISDKKN